jgi:hypothetical protein
MAADVTAVTPGAVERAWRCAELARLAGAGLEHGSARAAWPGPAGFGPAADAAGGAGDELALLRGAAAEAARRGDRGRSRQARRQPPEHGAQGLPAPERGNSLCCGSDSTAFGGRL